MSKYSPDLNQVLEYLSNYPEQTKRVIGITDIQLRKLRENAHKKESEKRVKNDYLEKLALAEGASAAATSLLER
ncbi:hypothetical protein [Dapis sp. BLCC M229]|uniref:hypothetical protein n=1 Tax=Dapis sp. BLCC M229 TaxID=3400188 RepID=UPI003CF8D41F